MIYTIAKFLRFNLTPIEKDFDFEKPQKPKRPTPLARRVRDYLMAREKGLTAQEALVHFQGMTSATLARRITELKRYGWPIINERRLDEMTGRLYTRYRLDFTKDWPSIV